MTDPIDQATATELRMTVPTEFVSVRNRIAKELRAAKRREEAASIAALRRPGWADWALNVTALEHADDVAAFVAAAQELQDAQAATIEGRSDPDVRQTLQAMRGATTDVVRLAGKALRGRGRSADTAELSARLAEVAAHPAALAQLQAATLGTSDPGEPDVFAGLFGDLRPSPGPAAAAPGAKRPKPTRSSRREPDVTGAAVDERDAAAATRAAAKRAARDADVAAAESDLHDANRDVSDADVASTATAEAVAAATRALRAANDDHAVAERAHRQAIRAATEAERRLAKARKTLDRVPD